MNVRKWILIIVVPAILVKIVLSVSGSTKSKECIKVKAGTVKKSRVTLTVMSPYEVTNEKSLDFLIKEGSSVLFYNQKLHYKKGDTILILKNEELQIRLQKAKLEYEEAKRNFLKTKELYDNKLVGEDRYKEDTMRLEKSRLSLEGAKNSLKNLILVAPFDGNIDLGGNSIYKGEKFYKNVYIRFLSDKIKVNAYVIDFQFLSIANILQNKDTVFLNIITPKSISFYAKPFISGNSKKIEGKNYYEVVFYPYGNPGIRNGLSGELTFRVQSKKPLSVIPQDALFGIDTPFVYIVKNHIAIKKPIQTGFIGDSLIEVKNLENDTIITGPLNVIPKLYDSAYVCY